MKERRKYDAQAGKCNGTWHPYTQLIHAMLLGVTHTLTLTHSLTHSHTHNTHQHTYGEPVEEEPKQRVTLATSTRDSKS